MSPDQAPALLKEFFEDYAVGDELTTQGRTITESDIVQFASFSGDWNAVHTDRHYAEQHTPFGQRIAHGMLVLSAALSMFFKRWSVLPPRSWVVLSSLDKVRFSAPIHIGDTIRLEAEVVEATPMEENRGLLTFRVRIKNQDDVSVITCRLKLVVGARAMAGETETGEEDRNHA